MHRSAVLLSLALVTGCGTNNTEPVSFDWSDGQTWHVAAQYVEAAEMGENGTTSLDGLSTDAFSGKVWSNEIVWTYQVVETGLVPTEDDDLHPFSLTGTGEVAALSVVRAWADGSLNTDSKILEADPVIYLVFHEERDRLAGIVTFVNENGTRVEDAYSSTDLSKSWSFLSQSGLSKAPAFLPPRGVTFASEDRVLENGSIVSTDLVDSGTVETYFDDEVGGDLVVTRVEDGQPWPTLTATDNMEAVLLTEDAVDARRVGPMLREEPPADFDYRAALRSSVDVEGAFAIDAQTLADGGWTESVYEGFEPWAGDWWKLSQAELVFGFESGASTYSERIKEDIEQLKRDMDNLQDDLRDMEKSDEGYNDKVQEYQDKNNEVVEKLVAFYDDILADLDGGILVVEDGTLTHTEDGWSYDVDKLSPFDKYALVLYLQGETSPNPFYLPAWELLNQWNPSGGSWWGHCNGWAAAAILTHEPREPLTVTAGSEEITLSTGDLKGLLTEAHYSVYSSFVGARYYGEESDINDLYPKGFHHFIDHYIRTQGVPVVFDTDAGDAVWNFPAHAAAVEITEVTPQDRPELLNLNEADLETLKGTFKEDVAANIIEHREYYGAFQDVTELQQVKGVSKADFNTLLGSITVNAEDTRRTFEVTADVRFTTDSVPPEHVDADPRNPQGFTKTWDYELITNADGVIIASSWDDDDSHPDFGWVPYHNTHERENGGSENPFLRYGTLLDVIGDDFERK